VYLREITIEHVKLIRRLELSCVLADGAPRMWTMLIGENGTGKTSILQAIAMAAAGSLQVNSLADAVVGNLRDRRTEDTMKVQAVFAMPPPPPGASRMSPGLIRSDGEIRIESVVTLAPNESTIRSQSKYIAGGTPAKNGENPIDTARAQNLPLWFVAGYGVARVLPDASLRPSLTKPSIERMAPLFDSRTALTSTAFANYFDEDPDKVRMYSRVLKRALFNVEGLLPGVVDLELKGYGGVRRAGHLQDSKRFTQRIGPHELRVPAVALSHGYQSTIAWIADLVGHVVLEANNEIEPQDMQGLVLIDEIDLYLHPTWQVVLVNALRQTFPRMQFIATTHSPLVLAGMRPDSDRIVRLQISPQSGDIEEYPVDADPRLLTGTEIFREYFGIDDIHPDEAGRVLREYRYLAANPFRSDVEDRSLRKMEAKLRALGISPHFTPVPREKHQKR